MLRSYGADTILGALVGARPGKMPAASSGTLLVMAFGGRDPETGRPWPPGPS